MSEHALLSASSSERWLNCPSSVALCKDIPSTTSKYSEEGTLAHSFAAAYLVEADLVPPEPKSDLYEMHLEVMKYVDFVRSIIDNGTLMVEKRVDYSSYIGVPDSFGTSDAIIVSEDGEEIIVVDLKYGANPNNRVDAEENSQLMLYALGALDELSFVYPNIKRVRLIIHQPRLDHVSEWDCTVEELLVFAQIAADAAARAINPMLGAPEIDLHPGEKQCRFCPAKKSCPALQNYVATATADQFDIIDDELTEETLDLIEGWIKAKRADIERRLFSGEKLKYWKLVAGRKGKRAWRNEQEAEATLKSMRLKKEEMYDYSVISPTTAEKLLKDTPRRWSKVESLIVQKEGKPSIASIDSKYPALVMTPAEDGFEIINNEGEENAD